MVQAMLYNSTRCPSFTLEQLTALATWNLIRPAGLGVRIVKDHERFPEVAMLFRYDPEDVRYLVNPTSRGMVVLVRSSGGKWALPTVEAALSKVLALEKGDVAATKATTRTANVGAASQARP